MFKTEGVIITNAGFAFLNDIVANSKQPIWTTIKLGNGDINSEAEARALTNLVSEVKNSGISGHEITPEGYLQLKTNYDNNNLIEDIVIKETGVYAKTADNQTEILVAYVNDGIGETLPAYNGKNPIQRVRNIIIGITQQLNSIVQINKDMYVTIYDLERKVDKISIKTEQLTNTDTDIMSSSASRNLFENGVGADVMGYIEDWVSGNPSHLVGEVWLSRNNKGEFKCLIENSDNYVDAAKWLQIDDLSNSSKILEIKNATYYFTGTSGIMTMRIKYNTITGIGVIQLTSGANFFTVTQNIEYVFSFTNLVLPEFLNGDFVFNNGSTAQSANIGGSTGYMHLSKKNSNTIALIVAGNNLGFNAQFRAKIPIILI